jgi:cytochrome c peroxidase
MIKPIERHQMLMTLFVIGICCGLLIFFYQTTQINSTDTLPPIQITRTQTTQAITPLPQNSIINENKVALGSRLFHDAGLSRDGTVSCASCHRLNTGGVDNLPHSIGVNGQEGGINAPTVFNSYYNFVQFWDGRAANLSEQAAGPIHNPIEMGSNWEKVLAYLNQDATYGQAFAQNYPDGITAKNVQDAIATFESSLITPNAPFDRFLRGDKQALSAQSEAGYTLFKQVGCISCHQGINIGGNLYQKLGIMDNYFANKALTDADMGRYNVSKQESDRHFFKVPTLRNIAATAPYLHDGSQKTLADTVKIMAQYQLGKNLSEDEISLIVAFLHSLTGEYQGKPVK